MSGTEQQALADALSAEYATIYAYGLVASHAGADQRGTVAQFTAAHRARRDATVDILSGRRGTVPAPDAAYTMPLAVSDPDTAAQLAIAVETDTAVAWRTVVERAETDNTRRIAIEALTETAGRRAVWQSLRGADPATTAFPGRP
ncbi:ferritin-like domain-containing protein [Nocardia speluncae]|uniref:Ferritin-like domain-containing protein n=1 Tax=Nocardia speluncae TaxID=419477 RepID=A0A846XKI9_9NOCA|nr:ferritin-like domain-containing protein [Nocardia speluncae]NKY35160.1 ferritin-like domain-containing protein [Nocardia speluncae]